LDLNMSKKETQQIKKKKISLKKCMVIKNKWISKSFNKFLKYTIIFWQDFEKFIISVLLSYK